MLRTFVLAASLLALAACGQLTGAKDKGAPEADANAPAAATADTTAKPGEPAPAETGKPPEPAQAPAGAAPDKPA